MSLLVCPECGGKVSSMAPACPHCGCPTEFIMNNPPAKPAVDEQQQTFEPQMMRCPVCHAMMDKNVGVCEVCRYVLKEETKNTTCKIGDKLYDLRPVLELLKENNINEAQRKTSLITKLDMRTADLLTELINRNKEIPLEFNLAQYQPVTNLPKCPTCGSTNIEKIDALTRGVSLGLFGLASKTARSQFHCRGCGYKW